MPATLFNLWNPYRADDGTLTFEITQADTFLVHQGTKEFMDVALRAFGVEAAAYRWQITPGRASYYSDDPDREDWRDRWPRTWRVQIFPEVPLPPRPNTLFRTPADQPLSDMTGSAFTGGHDERYRHTAFVIVDFRASLEDIEQTMRRVVATTTLRVAPLEPAIRELGGQVRQLQLLVGEIDLPGDVRALDTLIAGFKAGGGAVNWRSRLTWPTEPSKPQPPDIAAWLSSLETARKTE